jgi:hypothetical protein
MATSVKNRNQAVVYCVVMANEPVDDVRPFLPVDVMTADRNNVPLTDRNGGSYTGRVVKTGGWSECQDFVRSAFKAGQLSDGTEVGDGNPFVTLGLDRMPRGGKVHFTVSGR